MFDIQAALKLCAPDVTTPLGQIYPTKSIPLHSHVFSTNPEIKNSFRFGMSKNHQSSVKKNKFRSFNRLGESAFKQKDQSLKVFVEQPMALPGLYNIL